MASARIRKRAANTIFTMGARGWSRGSFWASWPRWTPWLVIAGLLAGLPLVFHHDASLGLLTQVVIMMVFALSYNMLLGETGLLSFGHAIYAGLGAFFAIHAMNMIGSGSLHCPVSLLPLIAGVGALGFGIVLGYVTTRRGGTPFAMITLGLGELVYASSQMFPDFFGGEGGVSSDRTAGPPLLGVRGWNLGAQIQVYYVAAAWCLLCIVAIYALTRTPFGRIANAVRDNPERAEFVGYNAQRVRWLMLALSSFFAGIAGGLSAINFEIVSAENVGALRSGGVLIAVFIGGTGFFYGPIIGAAIFVLAAVALSEYSKAWQLYLGVFFVLLVMFAPGGLSSVIAINLRRFGQHGTRRLLLPYAALVASGILALAGFVALVEMSYRRTLESSSGPLMQWAGIRFDITQPTPWVVALGLLLLAGTLSWRIRPIFAAAWDANTETSAKDSR